MLLLPSLARALAVGGEDQIGKSPGTTQRGPRPKLKQRHERITRLIKAQQRSVKQMFDSLIQQADR